MKYLSDEKLLKTMRIFYWAAQYRIKCSNAFETVKKNVKKNYPNNFEDNFKWSFI